MRVLALTKYGTQAASTRQRFTQYEPSLAAAGISVVHAPLLGNDHLRRLVGGKRASVLSLSSAYAHRVMWLLGAGRYDLLWVHCELFPYLPALMERLATIWGKPVLFDYDDAIFHMYDFEDRTLLRRLLGGKLEPLLRRACACCCGNAYLRDYAAHFCPNSLILPTVVNTDVYRPVPKKDGGPPVVGWIGSPSTWAYARPLIPLLRDFARSEKARVKIVGAGAAAEADRFPGLELVEWSEQSEVAEVQSMDIGIMPLTDDRWARGKSGYKIVQYMACGLPVVASPVGVNSEMVTEGLNGFLAASDSQWRDALERLAGNAELRQRLGKAGRDRAIAVFSLQAQAPRLVKVMLDCVRKV
jgi:glycosyltransferase involved in cell wall biosynthesis